MNRLIFELSLSISILFCFFGFIQAQETEQVIDITAAAGIDDPEYIEDSLDMNRIWPIDSSYFQLILPGKQDALKPLYDKLFDLRTHASVSNNVNILHIGGSHVQAGVLSNTIRMHFSPSAERGYLFPFRAIKTNSPQGYRFDYTGLWKGSRCVNKDPDVELGLNGAAAITSDKEASLTLHLRDEGKWDFNQLILQGCASDSTVIPYIITSAQDTLFADPVLSHLSIRDSWTFNLPQPDSVVTLKFIGLTRKVSPKQKRKTYLPLEDRHSFTLYGMLPKSDRHGVTYTESGINGAAVPSWLRTGQRFEEELSLLPPDLVVFGIGINDANVPMLEFNPEVFKNGYKQLIERIRSVNPDACLIFITNNDCAYTIGKGRRAKKIANPNTERVRQAMIELAQELNGAVFDVYGLMGGIKSSEKWVEEGLMKKDRIHFTNEGYRLIGDLLYNAIEKNYQKFYK